MWNKHGSFIFIIQFRVFQYETNVDIIFIWYRDRTRLILGTSFGGGSTFGFGSTNTNASQQPGTAHVKFAPMQGICIKGSSQGIANLLI